MALSIWIIALAACLCQAHAGDPDQDPDVDPDPELGLDIETATRKTMGMGNAHAHARKVGAAREGRVAESEGKAGDLRLTAEQWQDLFGKDDEDSSGNRTKRAGSLTSVYYWQGGQVPFFIERKDFRPEEYEELREAMEIYETETCIQFVNADPTQHKSHLWIHHTNEGCYSYLGDLRKGRQEISLQADNCRHFGTYLHELGHALGMIHEHQRPDRNDYVHYYPANVDPNNADQLELYKPSAVKLFQNIPYDLGSIMHYEVDSFSVDDVSPTLGVDNPWLAKFIGRRFSNILSYGDVKLLNMAYRCGAECSKSVHVSCQNGFVNKDCECVTQEDYTRDVCTNDPEMVDWCYDLAIQGQCDVENIEHHRRCARACDFCPRFKLGQRAVVAGRRPTKTEMMAYCQDQYVYPKLCQKWAAAKRCQLPWMQRYCRLSCGACQNRIGLCPNKFDDALCDRYAAQKACLRRGQEGDFVRKKCRDSCGLCFKTTEGDCRNRATDAVCKAIDNQRQCELAPLVAFQSCPSTCNRCDFNAGKCNNKSDDNFCAQAAAKNMCDHGVKQREIKKQCPKSCNKCGIFSRLF